MKGIGVAFVAGVLGVLIGSLAAQGPSEFGGAPEDGVPAIFEGEIDVFSYQGVTAEGATYPVTVQTGTPARVYEGWVYLPETRTFVSSERAGALSFRGGARRAAAQGEEFGADPQGGRPERGERPGRSNTFRED